MCWSWVGARILFQLNLGQGLAAYLGSGADIVKDLSMGRWGSSHLTEIYFLCEIYDKVISWREGQGRVCWRLKRREGSVMVSSEIGKLNFLRKCSRFFWQCWVRFVVMFVASLVSKFGSFFLQQRSAALVQAPHKWLGHQTGGLMGQHSRRREARRFGLLARGWVECGFWN